MKKIKNFCKNLKKVVIKRFKKRPSDVIVPIFSILNFIFTLFIFNILIDLIILIGINLVYFGSIYLINRIKTQKKNESLPYKVTKTKSKKTYKGNNKFIKLITDNPISTLIVVVSIIIFILATILFKLKVGIIILVIIHLIYWPCIIISNRRMKKNSKNKKYSSKSKKTVKKKQVSKFKRIIKVLLLLFLIMFIFIVFAMIAFIIYIVKTAPEFNEELLYLSDPTVILDKDGNEIAKIGAERRTKIEYDDISEVLKDAIIATEDSNFFEHNGVDWARFMKASIYQVLGQSDAGGASTLTMQISKNRYTNKEASGIEGIIRKFTDVYVSMFVLEKNYTKEQILEFYVNSQQLGKNSFGVEQASRTYFGKSANELNLAEAAMIAGLFQAPSKYNPYRNPEATEARRITVLKLMLRHGYINKDEYEIAKKLSVDKIVLSEAESANISGEVSKYQSFIDTVIEEVKEKTGQSPYKTTMTITTTLNTEFQDYINNIMNGETYNWENDVVQAGVAVINVHDGSVAAIGGGRNVNAIDMFNYATDMHNQIGSTAKPLYDYGPAIEYNNWSTAHTIVDEPYTYSNGVNINNWDSQYVGLETIREALMQSRNIPALKTFQQNDKAKVIEFVTGMGLTPEIYTCNEGYVLDKSTGKTCINKEDSTDVVDANRDSSLHEAHAIGGYNGESPLTMAAAYATFANYGTYNEPHTFTKLVYQSTGEEYVNEYKTNEVMTPQTAYMITDMLLTTAPYALGSNYYINGIKYAAKTGTTNFDEAKMKAKGLPGDTANDLWVVGYNTDYAIAVWYGYDNADWEYHNTMGSGQHSRLFNAVGRKIFTNGNSFWMPDGIVAVTIEHGCAEPCLPSEFTPSEYKKTELFLRGTTPTQVSGKYAKLKSVTGLKSSFKDNKVTLTWDKVSYPKEWTESYLRETYSKVYTNTDALNELATGGMTFAENHLGVIGYNVYEKDEDGKLTLLAYVTNNKYVVEPKTDGEHTYVVKTSYSIFKDNESDGNTIKVTVKLTQNTNNNNNTNNNEENNNNNDNPSTEPSTSDTPEEENTNP